ncbi:8455_t:CDS:2 [Paraglomus brasilianum]|uniref:8455_t:CDS:1 n=1 Tax=Paraglomus brasilianum TaxID=144538 RepID=A0A9N9FJ44_9GLOM|nr:8455_t:CDS:2 [Paraglomus brasilianum]
MRWILSFTAVILIGLVSGTQYLFSAYGPALADRLNLSSTQTNVIASAGNYGLFLSSPFNGYLADNYGPRRVCLAGSVLISASFLGLALTYNGVLPSSFLLCAVYLMLTGIASSAGFMSAFTTSAKNFPNLRGVGLSIPLACFALSASIFSLVNSLFFKDDTYRFLVFIAISTGLCQFIGAYLLDPISLESITDSDSRDDLNETTQRSSDASVEAETSGHGENRQLVQNEETPSLRRLSGVQSLEINTDSQLEQNEETPLLKRLPTEPDISGRRLLLNGDAQLLFLAIFFLGGAGLMYINNVGTIVKLLYVSSSGNSPNPSHELQHIQNLHVFLISIFSCIGRLSTGISSDITKSSEWFGLKQFGFNWGIMTCVSTAKVRVFREHGEWAFAIGSQVFGCATSIFVSSGLLRRVIKKDRRRLLQDE